MSEPLRPDLFKVSFGSVPEGLYVLEIDLPLKARVLPKLVLDDFIGSSVAFLGPLKDEEGYQFTLPAISKNYVSSGDIVQVRRSSVRILLSKSANANTLLLTERCDNRCLFCSQPPKEAEDSYLFVDAAMALSEFQSESVIGLSGGEPFLDPQKVFSLFDTLDSQSLQTPLHILTNGRVFSAQTIVAKLESYSRKRELVLGIPLYATNANIHDTLVVAQGAWHDTVQGLINLSHSEIGVELRFIPTKFNVDELPEIIPFVSKYFGNRFFVSVMNLEATGWAKKNWNDLYLSPARYGDKLSTIRKQATLAGINLRLFNYPLCHLPEDVMDVAVKSISDWKNTYHAECERCIKKNQCGGYFTSAKGALLDPPRSFR